MSISLSRLQTFYSELDAVPLIQSMYKEFGDRLACFSSFGAYSALLVDIVAEVDKNIPILFIDTEKHFKETYDYVEDVKQATGIKNIISIKPNKQLEANIDPNGDLWKSQPNRCCWLRKVKSLDEFLEETDYQAIVTGRRSYQTSERQNLDRIELDEDKRFKINPILNWSKDDIKAEFARRNLPQHPLVANGYPSIGCEPCTVAVKPGEDERSGRWAHTIDMDGKQKAECGIHLPEAGVTDWSV